ncbi:tyrosine-protein phosphatase [Mollicutes bacterium LVI A0039]|nr:tyrosine-protein phosphatase [Mollicutes bacterium LVI A0039]
MIYNFKQLAEGYVNKEGKALKVNKLMRSGYISPIEEHLKFINSLGDITLFDFRSSSEIEREPNFTELKVEYYPLGKKVNEKQMNANALSFQTSDMVAFYQNGFTECEYLHRAVRDIVLNPRPVLYHCSAGKDRTGVFSIVLMHILDFDYQAQLNHYLELDPRFVEHAKAKFKMLYPELDDSGFEDLLTVKQEYFEAFYQAIVDTYGDFDSFVAEFFELSSDDIENFKQFCLQDS